ncbi:MAG: hypothetical protein ACKOW8_12000 [Flavobacteriales bacterium]
MQNNDEKSRVSDVQRRLQKLEKDNEKLEAALAEREAVMANLFSFIEGTAKSKEIMTLDK